VYGVLNRRVEISTLIINGVDGLSVTQRHIYARF